MALLAVLAVGAWGAYAVFAAAAPPAPSITVSPANPTNSTSAAFSYSDSQSGVTFTCTLDSVAKTCPASPSGGTTVGSVTFPVAAGSHTFSISAVAGGKTSSATSYTWTVDTTAPTVSPPALAGSSPTNATSVSWTVTFSEPVKNVATSNFTLVPTNLTGSSITGLSGSGASYTVTANTGSLTVPTSNGSLGLNMTSKGTITDLAGNPLAALPGPGAVYTIDRTPPPAPTITSGPSGTVNQNSATFSFSDSEGGISYLCKLDAAAYTACGNPATFTGLADGSHSLTVEAKDAAGNISGLSAPRTWTVDTTAPPKPGIVGPNNKSDSTAATFTFSDSEANVTYLCNFDYGAYVACPNPKTFTLLSPGTHEVDVEAVDQAGNISTNNGWKWTINGLSGSGMPFGISGNASGPLTPGGVSRYFDLSLSNPNSVTIYITSLTVTTPTITTSHAGPNPCTTADFDLTHLQFSGAYPITLPPGTKTLSQLGYSQPQMPNIAMFNRHDTTLGDHTGNQDRCKNASLSFTYHGNAQS